MIVTLLQEICEIVYKIFLQVQLIPQARVAGSLNNCVADNVKDGFY